MRAESPTRRRYLRAHRRGRGAAPPRPYATSAEAAAYRPTTGRARRLARAARARAVRGGAARVRYEVAMVACVRYEVAMVACVRYEVAMVACVRYVEEGRCSEAWASRFVRRYGLLLLRLAETRRGAGEGAEGERRGMGKEGGGAGGASGSEAGWWRRGRRKLRTKVRRMGTASDDEDAEGENLEEEYKEDWAGYDGCHAAGGAAAAAAAGAAAGAGASVSASASTGCERDRRMGLLPGVENPYRHARALLMRLARQEGAMQPAHVLEEALLDAGLLGPLPASESPLPPVPAPREDQVQRGEPAAPAAPVAVGGEERVSPAVSQGEAVERQGEADLGRAGDGGGGRGDGAVGGVGQSPSPWHDDACRSVAPLPAMASPELQALQREVSNESVVLPHFHFLRLPPAFQGSTGGGEGAGVVVERQLPGVTLSRIRAICLAALARPHLPHAHLLHAISHAWGLELSPLDLRAILAQTTRLMVLPGGIERAVVEGRRMGGWEPAGEARGAVHPHAPHAAPGGAPHRPAAVPQRQGLPALRAQLVPPLRVPP
ncbi:unnamed protein product [Closterium sp. Yama58-4]|nr:unnamed protein product [Closterium sp. Yama58-4]